VKGAKGTAHTDQTDARRARLRDADRKLGQKNPENPGAKPEMNRRNPDSSALRRRLVVEFGNLANGRETGHVNSRKVGQSKQAI